MKIESIMYHQISRYTDKRPLKKQMKLQPKGGRRDIPRRIIFRDTFDDVASNGSIICQLFWYF